MRKVSGLKSVLELNPKRLFFHGNVWKAETLGPVLEILAPVVTWFQCVNRNGILNLLFFLSSSVPGVCVCVYVHVHKCIPQSFSLLTEV